MDKSKHGPKYASEAQRVKKQPSREVEDHQSQKQSTDLQDERRQQESTLSTNIDPSLALIQNSGTFNEVKANQTHDIAC